MTLFLSMSTVSAASADSLTEGRIQAATTAIINAQSITTAIRLDGQLTEACWASADSITELYQREPNSGALASEQTCVKVARDHDALYVAVGALDSDASRLRATQLRRDANLDVDDNVTLLLDSFHYRRSAFVFQTNPRGARWDAQLSGNDNLNEDWNGIWDVTCLLSCSSTMKTSGSISTCVSIGFR